MAIKAVIFDLDGVIVTTDDYHYEAWKMVADEENIYFDKEINERLRGVSRMESLEIILEKSLKKYSSKEKDNLAKKKNEYYKTLLKNLSTRDILPGVIKLLEILKEKNIKTAIGSSSKNTMMILNKIEMTNYFDVVVDGTMIKESKPNPEVFIKAANLLGISYDSCLVIEDADAGVKAAKNAGMKVLGVGSARNNSFNDYSINDLSDVEIFSIIR